MPRLSPSTLRCRWQCSELLEKLELIEVQVLRGDVAVADGRPARVAKLGGVAASRDGTRRPAKRAGVRAGQRALDHDRVARRDLSLAGHLCVRQGLPEARQETD